MSKEAMKLALEALQKIYIAPEHEDYIKVWWPACEQAITALREALPEQPAQQQKPTCKQNLQVWVIPNGRGGGQFSWEPEDERFWTRMQPAQPYKGIADYTHQSTNGRAHIDPVTGAFGIGTLQEQPAQQVPLLPKENKHEDRN